MRLPGIPQGDWGPTNNLGTGTPAQPSTQSCTKSNVYCQRTHHRQHSRLWPFLSHPRMASTTSTNWTHTEHTPPRQRMSNHLFAQLRVRHPSVQQNDPDTTQLCHSMLCRSRQTQIIRCRLHVLMEHRNLPKQLKITKTANPRHQNGANHRHILLQAQVDITTDHLRCWCHCNFSNETHTSNMKTSLTDLSLHEIKRLAKIFQQAAMKISENDGQQRRVQKLSQTFEGANMFKDSTSQATPFENRTNKLDFISDEDSDDEESEHLSNT